MSLRNIAAANNARLDSRTFTCAWRAAKQSTGSRPSDVDLSLDQQGWITLLEGKPISLERRRSVETFSDCVSVYREHFMTTGKWGQHFMIEAFRKRAAWFAIAFSLYEPRPGYAQGECLVDGKKRIYVEGPQGGTDFGHPSIHRPLMINILPPASSRKLYEAALSFLTEWAQDKIGITVLSDRARRSHGIWLLLPFPTGDAEWHDVCDDSYYNAAFALNTWIADEYGSVSLREFVEDFLD